MSIFIFFHTWCNTFVKYKTGIFQTSKDMAQNRKSLNTNLETKNNNQPSDFWDDARWRVDQCVSYKLCDTCSKHKLIELIRYTCLKLSKERTSVVSWWIKRYIGGGDLIDYNFLKPRKHKTRLKRKYKERRFWN